MARGLWCIYREKTNLISGQAVEGASVVSVDAIIITSAISPEFSPEAPFRQTQGRRRKFLIDEKFQRVSPPPNGTEGIELMLLDDMSSVPIRIYPILELGVGQQVDLAVSLLEWLTDVM